MLYDTGLDDFDRVALVAELGINHNGSLDVAKRLIDVAADTGCDAVKFQKRTVELVYSADELDKPRESPWGSTNRAQKLGLEFGIEEYGELDAYCRSRGIEWFASCWDLESVKFIDQFEGVRYHKVASALVTRRDLLRAMRDSGRSVMLSTGMSTIEEVETAIVELGSSLDTVMHCTSTYPTAPSEVNMSVIDTMRCGRSLTDDTGRRCRIPFGTRVGFSNHYSGLVWAPMAVALGAQVLEFHVTLDRTMYGSDQAASIEPDGVRRLVEHVRLAEEMLGDGVKRVYDSELPVRAKLRGV